MRILGTAAVLVFGLLLVGCSSSGGGAGAAAQDSAGPPDNPGTPPADNPPAAPSALLVLGDSLSDVGNAAAAADYLLSLPIVPATVGLCNPVDILITPRPCDDLFYGQSRVADGPVALEYLADSLGLAELVPSLHLIPGRPAMGTNYAIAGATARASGETDLSRQLDAVLLDRGPSLPTDAVYAIVIGGNDAIDALQAKVSGAPDADQTSAAIIAAAVTAIGDTLERLLDFGARRIVVANVPDLAMLPAVRASAAASGDEAALLATASQVSASFNGALDARLDTIETSGQWLAPTPPVLTRFDLHAALHAVDDDVIGAGGNTADACFDSTAYRDSPTAVRSFHPDCAPQAGGDPRFDAFVFWDGIHPTGATHAAIGAELSAVLP